jgi:hypothetical protein
MSEWMSMGHRWNDTDRQMEVLGEKTCPSLFSSTTKPTWTRLVLNPGLFDEGHITCCFLDYKLVMVRIKVPGDMLDALMAGRMNIISVITMW